MSGNPKAHQLQAGMVYAQEDSICSQSSDLTSSNEYFCLQVKIQCTQANTKSPTPYHLITNLAYQLKPHHKRNQYLRARLDTCANVNIMPASVYKLVFQDPDCKKLVPSKLEIGTYTTDTVKLVGSCMFHLVHPDSKHLLEHSVWPTIMAVSCYHVWQLLLLAWFNLALDWIIFHPETVLLLAVLIIQRRPNPNPMCMCQRKSLKYLTTKIWFPSFIQVRNKFLPIMLMFLIVLDAFLVPHTIFRWIIVSHQSKPPVDQSLFIWKKLSRWRLTRCYMRDFLSLWTKQLTGSTVLY